MDYFTKAHEFTAAFEGGYVNHKNDPGGETNLGVTKAQWSAWCKAKGLPLKPMRSLTPADVIPLYRAWYWEPLAASLPWPLSAAVYDMTVNHGLGKPGVSGAHFLLGQARKACPAGSPLQIALAAVDAREAFYRRIVANKPSQGVFLKGWLRRVNAQREWLRENAKWDALPRVFMRHGVGSGGANLTWDGKPTIYNGLNVSAETVAAWALVYPPRASSVIPTKLGGVKLSVYPDGAIQLERVG